MERNVCQLENRFPLTKPWMMDLRNQLVSEVTLPGTHDSCCNVDCGILKCQTWSLERQLSSGVRFLDIRCRHVTDKFVIHHDWVNCGLTFDDVLRICKSFLNEFPSECLIMRVKEEFLPSDCSRNFEDTFDEYYRNYTDLIYLNQRIPFLNDLRGKIWVLSEMSRLKSFNWKQAKIQDMWNIQNSYSMKVKVDKIKKHFQDASSGQKDCLYFNFLSGTGDYAWPNKISNITNKLALKYKGRVGVVIFDFVESKMIDYLISQNSFTNYSFKLLTNRKVKKVLSKFRKNTFCNTCKLYFPIKLLKVADS